MSDTALSSIQEIIERSIFEIIRLEIVDKGYLPDIADTGTYPDTDSGHAQWETDINAIVASKGFAIELFGAGNSQAKGTKKVPRMVIESGNFLPGALGGDPRRYFSDQGGDYQALVTPLQTVDFYLNFCLVSNTAAQSRILNAILALTIKRRGYIPWYSDGVKTFFARYLNYYDRNDEDKGIIEHVYAYEIPDAWDHEDVEVYASIAKLNELTFNINIQKYEDGSWGHDATSMVIV